MQLATAEVREADKDGNIIGGDVKKRGSKCTPQDHTGQRGRQGNSTEDEIDGGESGSASYGTAAVARGSGTKSVQEKGGRRAKKKKSSKMNHYADKKGDLGGRRGKVKKGRGIKRSPLYTMCSIRRLKRSSRRGL